MSVDYVLTLTDADAQTLDRLARKYNMTYGQLLKNAMNTYANLKSRQEQDLRVYVECVTREPQSDDFRRTLAELMLP